MRGAFLRAAARYLMWRTGRHGRALSHSRRVGKGRARQSERERAHQVTGVSSPQ
jgi:hypothetical protein